MSSDRSIREILLAEVEAATKAQKQADAAFSAVLKDVPSGLPHPDGSLRIEAAKRAVSKSIDNYIAALREYNAYVLIGKVPDRLSKEFDGADGEKP